MSASSLYTYTSGELFRQPNSYMYPPIHDHAFLVDYESNRVAAIGHLIKRANDLDMAARGFIASAFGHYRGVERVAELNQLGVGGRGDFSQLFSEKPEYLNQAYAEGIANTRRLFQALLSIAGNPAIVLNSHYSSVLRQMLRNFEVRRVIFKSYENNLRKGVEITGEPELYAQLGFLAALELDGSPSLQITNVLLKINDSLINAHEAMFNPMDCALGALSLGCELGQIRYLMMKRGIG